jgi:chromosomal replication initiator protein
MSLSAVEVWDRLLARARQELSAQTVRTWLEPTAALSVTDRTLVIGTPDRFSAEWNESKHAPLLAGLAPVALGHPMDVVFQVDEAMSRRPQMDLLVEPPPPQPVAPMATMAAVAAARGPQATGGAFGGYPAARMPQPTGVVSAPLNPRYTFDHFVIGKSNDVAAAASQGAAMAPGKVYNPLFIYGDTGLGKTHLMQAVAHVMLERTPATRITYVNTEQFTNEFIGALQSRSTQDFRRRYRETDLLLVDDVQFLKGKESTQEEFFHTFNAIYEAGRQIVLTSDRPPKEIPGLEARLVSRFEWGLVANVEQPDLEHRVAILRKKAEQDHLELTIPDDVLEFIAQHVKSSVRELEGSIIKLLAYASLKHRDITVELAREALRDKLSAEAGFAALQAGAVPGTGRGGSTPSAQPGVVIGVTAGMPISPFVIQQAVAAEWGVTPDGLQSKTRTKTLTVPRQVAMWLCRELLALQLVEIGGAFGGRDHSTVIHSLERALAMMDEDPRFRARVEKVRGMLESLRH